MSNWTWNDNYDQAFAPTDDPRVFALITRAGWEDRPWGCAVAPTIYGSEWWSHRRYGELQECGCRDVSAPDWSVVQAALDHYGEHVMDLNRTDSLTWRYLRAFHDVIDVVVHTSSIDQYSWAIVLDTKSWRDHVGLVHDRDAGRHDEAKHYLDGEVYSVGWAVIPGRVLDLREMTWNDLTEQMTDIDPYECSGFYGEEWAKEAALSMEYGAPELDPLLPITA